MPAFPNDLLRIQRCTITSFSPTEQTKYGLNYETAKRGNQQQWQITMVTTPLDDEKSRRLSAFFSSLGGRFGTFTMKCPLRFMSGLNTFTVSGTYNPGVNVINVKNVPTNTVGVLKAGDYIKFANHDKAYQIVYDADSNASGVASVEIYPRLFSGVADNISINEATFVCRLEADTIALSLDASKGLTPVLIKAVEAT